MTSITNLQFNIGHICTKQQCDLGRADKTALRWLTPDSKLDYTYLDLEENSNKVANLLLNLGVTEGDRIFTFAPKSPEVFFIFLGILKVQAVAGILFSNFGEEALLDRLKDSDAKILFTSRHFLRKILAIWPQLPKLIKVITMDTIETDNERIASYSQLMAQASDLHHTPLTGPDTPSVLHYTSGSTGKPKGVLHVHGSICLQEATFTRILTVQKDDIYWCTADPGWVTGVSYGIVGPFSQGVTQILYGGKYNAKAWLDILQNEKVNVWYTAPTALRMLMQDQNMDYQNYDLSVLRSIFSVGEPLNPFVFEWARRVFKKDIYDTWFQTETGTIMIANRPGIPIKPGSMGKPFEEIHAAVLDDERNPVPYMTQGHLCLKMGWSSMFVTYLNRQSDYDQKFKHGYYDSGDWAYQDAEGYFWFVGRGDDVINTAGHLVGPFEIESALLEVKEVAESGVIGVPDEMLYEKVIAYVVIKPNFHWSRDLELKLRLHVSNRISSIATPQEFVVVDSIPKNKSGKIMRRVLKAWYNHQDIGDISTMEE